jgi:hypothetical protein
MEKKKCSGCKKKPINDLNNLKLEDENMPTIVKLVIVLYTILAVYGSIRLVMDLKKLVESIF